MMIEEARQIIDRFKKQPLDKLMSAVEKASSGAERRRLQRTHEEMEASRQKDNEAVAIAQRCMTIVTEIRHLLWYNGHAVDLDKSVGGADFIQDVAGLLENQGFKPGTPAAYDDA
jgi:hypothetical protein